MDLLQEYQAEGDVPCSIIETEKVFDFFGNRPLAIILVSTLKHRIYVKGLASGMYCSCNPDRLQIYSLRKTGSHLQMTGLQRWTTQFGSTEAYSKFRFRQTTAPNPIRILRGPG